MLAYGSNAVIDAISVKTVSSGSKGKSVTILQEALLEIGRGLNIKNTGGADGGFGAGTKKDLEEWLKGGRELCDKLFEDQYKASDTAKDRTNAIRCIENKAKNVGYYALDNAQKAEEAELTEVRKKEAKRLARLLNEDTVRRDNVIKLPQTA